MQPGYGYRGSMSEEKREMQICALCGISRRLERLTLKVFSLETYGSHSVVFYKRLDMGCDCSTLESHGQQRADLTKKYVSFSIKSFLRFLLLSHLLVHRVCHDQYQYSQRRTLVYMGDYYMIWISRYVSIKP